MDPVTRTYEQAAAFVDALAAAGVRHACISPGSRSSPLALQLGRHPAIRIWLHLDERSSGFFALGLAKSAREPVAILCTSGTAAANLLPAVVESRYGRVPLVILTADRPPELRDAGAPQTIDQLRLYGTHAKSFVDVPVLGEAGPGPRYLEALASRAVTTACAAPAGAVHLNFPFREPLVPAPGALPALGPVTGSRRRTGSGPRPPTGDAIARTVDELRGQTRGLIVCGPQDDPDLPAALAGLARATGFPILADPLSLARSGPHDRGLVVDAYDALLRDAPTRDALAPELVLRVGGVPTSKSLLTYLTDHPDARQIQVAGELGWNDPAFVGSAAIEGDPRSVVDALAAALRDGRHRPAGGRWAGRWRDLDRCARSALDAWLTEVDRSGEAFEGGAIAALAAALPDGATFYVGSSMPVRDLDAFVGGSGRAVRFVANRGANGIDGVLSSALGASVASDGPLALAIGDISFLHDLGGLAAAKRHGLRATVLLLNNDGGGIFSFLPVAEHEQFEALFGTPHGLDFSAVGRLFDVTFRRPEGPAELRAEIAASRDAPGVTVIEVRTERARNVVLHREAQRVVGAALAGLGAGAGDLARASR